MTDPATDAEIAHLTEAAGRKHHMSISPRLLAKVLARLAAAEQQRDAASRLLVSGGCQEHAKLPFDEYMKRGGDACRTCLFDALRGESA